jgi:hypothetical protein
MADRDVDDALERSFLAEGESGHEQTNRDFTD